MPVSVSYPGVYVEELSQESHLIVDVPTSTAVFLGRTVSGPVNVPTAVHSYGDFETAFGGMNRDYPLSYSVEHFFFNGGSTAVIVRLHNGPETVASQPLRPEDYLGDEARHTGLYALDKVDNFNLLCIPPDKIYPESEWVDIDELVWQTAANYCMNRRAFLIVDPPNSQGKSWAALVQDGKISEIDPVKMLGIVGTPGEFAAVYFPLVEAEDPLRNMEVHPLPICGFIAGIMSSTDASEGVWKAPAGLTASIQGIRKLQLDLNDSQIGVLNPLGVNCLRSIAQSGPVVWGARTLRGSDLMGDEFKYIPVRRFINFIESSVRESTLWTVFEPNNEELWTKLRESLSTFLMGYQRQGALYEYNVICNGSTTTYEDILNGRVNVFIQVAVLRPGEFINISIQLDAMEG